MSTLPVSLPVCGKSLWLEFIEEKGDSAILLMTVFREDTSPGSSKTRIQYKRGQYHIVTEKSTYMNVISQQLNLI